MWANNHKDREINLFEKSSFLSDVCRQSAPVKHNMRTRLIPFKWELTAVFNHLFFSVSTQHVFKKKKKEITLYYDSSIRAKYIQQILCKNNPFDNEGM